MRNNLTLLSRVFEQVTDPRGKQGREHPLSALLALTFLGLLAGQNDFTHIQYWAENNWKQLKTPLGFKTPKPPNRTTLSRLLAKISLTELQDAFAVFLSGLLQDKTLTAAVDGKTNKQMLDKDGNILQMLNVFVHDIKITLQEWSVSGEKTNEPNCLKQHLGELLRDFPHLKILTGDAVYANRPLLQVLQEHHLDYVFQIKENQKDLYDAVKMTFADKDKEPPQAQSVSKKRGEGNPQNLV